MGRKPVSPEREGDFNKDDNNMANSIRLTKAQYDALGLGDRVVGKPMKRKATTKKTAKTVGGRLNNSETTVLRMLKARYPRSLVLPHAIKLDFGDGTSYTPDLVVFAGDICARPTLVEVKGGYRGEGWEQGYERYRRARDLFSNNFQFMLFEKRKDGWNETR